MLRGEKRVEGEERRGEERKLVFLSFFKCRGKRIRKRGFKGFWKVFFIEYVVVMLVIKV